MDRITIQPDTQKSIKQDQSKELDRVEKRKEFIKNKIPLREYVVKFYQRWLDIKWKIVIIKLRWAKKKKSRYNILYIFLLFWLALPNIEWAYLNFYFNIGTSFKVIK